jgi:hypothetical protein
MLALWRSTLRMVCAWPRQCRGCCFQAVAFATSSIQALVYAHCQVLCVDDSA